MELFSMIILIFFAVIGLCAFITGVLDLFHKESGGAVLILSDLTPGEAEIRIRTAARICLSHTGIRLVCICGESDPAFEICRLLQRDYPFMEITQGFSV